MQILSIDYQLSNAPSLFCESLKTTGFAILNNHPISKNLIERVYQQWKIFFDSKSKIKYRAQKPAQDGYFPFRSENAKNTCITDLKEFYHFYPHGQQPLETQELSLALYYELTNLASLLLAWIEDGLPPDVIALLSMPLKDMIIESENTLLRILHYPPLNKDIEEGAVRAAAHEDINLITLLPAATAPGLQVLDTSNQWYTVSCDPGSIVVNVGDMLQLCTQNYYQSTTHRVINPAHDIDNNSRYSMPLFLHPRPEVILGNDCTAMQYLHERLRQIGIY